jgi:S-adenosyl-L-methionine hydrolase (adenosine-forming)
MHSPITLTTDFGTSDPYVAEMKGVILTLNRAVQIVDVSHQIAPQNIQQGALCVARMHRYFPAGTIHIVVVDPGVGSDRRLLCVVMHGQLFLGPDNGVLSWSARDAARVERIELTDSRYWLERRSATFHGRDILAPVAAHLSLGVAPDRLGSSVTDWKELHWPMPKRSGVELLGEVLAVDHFGNLITNIARSDVLANSTNEFRVVCGGVDTGRVVRTYSDVSDGELAAMFGSGDLLEISLRQGNAAERLGADVGSRVVVQLRPGP